MLLMSYRRNQQLRLAGERARRGRSSSAAVRGLPVVPRPRTPPAPTRPAPVRQTAAGAGEGSQPDTPQTGGLDWARRIELVAVVLGVLLSPLIAAAGIWYSNHQVRDQLKISSQELGVSREGQITDRYTKAVENLGDDAVDVRLGGVYALQRIMEDSPRDHPTIANVLATYVRTHASKPPKKSEDVPADVHAALTILARRDPTRDRSFTLDLRGTHLPGIELQPRHPREKPANLRGANLTGANLTGANLANAQLNGANLDDANLTGADLVDANLTGAHLSDAKLFAAHLPIADLNGTNLSGADLDGAYLAFANLDRANLIGADLDGANLSGADLDGADLEDANLKDADLTGADLDDTEGLQARQVVSAVIDSMTRLPVHLLKEPDIQARIAEVEKAAEDRG
jgi:uncharacterized protein YjbI with pentapeptide repeats